MKPQIASGGTLRVAINTANPVLTAKGADGQELAGVSIDLANEIARLLDLPVKLIPYGSAGAAFADAGNDRWDLTFMAIERERADKVVFSAPYIAIEGAYCCRRNAGIESLAQVDRPGVRIAVARNAAYDLFLSRNLKNAELVRADNPSAAFDAFLDGNLEAIAGVSQAIDALVATNESLVRIAESFMPIQQALAVPRRSAAAIDALDAILADLKSSGFVRNTLVRHRHGDVRVLT